MTARRQNRSKISDRLRAQGKLLQNSLSTAGNNTAPIDKRVTRRRDFRRQRNFKTVKFYWQTRPLTRADGEAHQQRSSGQLGLRCKLHRRSHKPHSPSPRSRESVWVLSACSLTCVPAPLFQRTKTEKLRGVTALTSVDGRLAGMARTNPAASDSVPLTEPSLAAQAVDADQDELLLQKSSKNARVTAAWLSVLLGYSPSEPKQLIKLSLCNFWRYTRFFPKYVE